MREGAGQAAIALMIRLETITGELYKKCAERFPDYEGFWERLASEEDAHAKLLGEIADNPALAAGFAERRQVAMGPLKFTVNFVDEQRAAVEAPDCTVVNALSIARDIEKSILEANAVRPAPGDPDAVRNMFARISAETTDHRARIESLLSQLKS